MYLSTLSDDSLETVIVIKVTSDKMKLKNFEHFVDKYLRRQDWFKKPPFRIFQENAFSLGSLKEKHLLARSFKECFKCKDLASSLLRLHFSTRDVCELFSLPFFVSYVTKE